jgi:hypothetical protein
VETLSDQVKDQEHRTVYDGEPDEEISRLIGKAIEILRHHISGMKHLEFMAVAKEGPVGRGRRSKKGKYCTDTEQFVVSALEQVLQGGATNIGCIVSRERANLLWHLYSQVTHFVVAPQLALPRTFRVLQQSEDPPRPKQHISNQKTKAGKPPSPHQFARRKKST